MNSSYTTPNANSHDEAPHSNNHPPNAPYRQRRHVQPIQRYGITEFNDPRVNESTSSFAVYRDQPLQEGPIDWEAVTSCIDWFEAHFNNTHHDPWADRSQVHLRALPSRLCQFEGLGLFAVGPPGGKFPKNSIIPYKGIFVRRNSPWHLWSPWHVAAQHSTKYVFIPDSRNPLPTIHQFGSHRIVPYANYSNRPWSNWMPPLPIELPNRGALQRSNARTVCCYRRDLCYLETTKDIHTGNEVLSTYK